MKKLFAMIGLSVALGLSTGYTNPNYTINTNDECELSTNVTLNGDYDHDRIGKSEFKGSLTNSSDLDYKDVAIRLDFFNDNAEMIGSHVVTVNEDVEAGETEDFEFEIQDPKGTDEARYTVMCMNDD